MSGFVRGDDTQLVRLARKLSEVEPQVQKRNFPSVKQIQDRLGWGVYVGQALPDRVIGWARFRFDHPITSSLNCYRVQNDVLFTVSVEFAIYLPAAQGLFLFLFVLKLSHKVIKNKEK